ncbi:hypothetical protein L195_g031678, partial [Trifolium pratense]
MGVPKSGYDFGVLLFILVENWNEYGDIRTLWVWGEQNSSPLYPIVMP